MALDFAGEIYIRQEGGGMLLGTYEQAAVPWSPKRDAVGLRVAAPEARPRPDHARAERRLQALPADGRRSASARSSTGRSRSRPTATRSSGRSAACAATGSRAA